MRNFLLVLTLHILPAICLAQNIKDAEIEYINVKLPLTPLPAGIKNYQVSIVAAYEEKNKALKQEYQKNLEQAKADYDLEMAKYPAKLKAAELQYSNDLEDYNKKSLGTKIVEKNILHENNKPVKVIPSKPYLKQVEKPYFQSTYDCQLLANTYIRLDNLENNPSNALKIQVTMYGYDFTQPQTLSTQKNMLSVGSGNTSTYTANYYYNEYSYRHPMAVKVIGADGKDIMNVTPQPLNLYKINRSSESQGMQGINAELIVKTTEEKILQENLTYINKLLNDRFGFYRENRKATLYYVKSKNEEYSDLMVAFNEASSALKLLADDSIAAKPQLLHAVENWNKALKESDLNDKKARIDKDLTLVILFNLLEVNLALRNHTAGMQLIQQLNTMSLSNKERTIKSKFETDFSDLKKRLPLN